ncbi:MAG: coproporphyrinogen III oxidase [Opitutae bacterium]|nr:coproporphyrinogen III oxidase [Opitutae bacterium]
MSEEVTNCSNSSDEDKTEAGNYFVSNYPPFAFWGEDDLTCLDSLLNSPQPGTAPLGLYYHIPFCRKRCHFCYFRVYTDKNSSQIRRYIAATMKELRRYAEKPYIKGRLPKFVYFGGGTPSYLSAKQLTELTDEMKEILPWDETEEVTFECEPGTLTEKKLEVIKGFGVTRLSLGIENFDDHVLGINGRAHRSEEVFRAYEFARSLDFEQVNVDLIAGMLEETEDNWKDSVRKAIELAPDSVTIYQMEIPFNTTIYRNMREEGKLTAPVADWPTKRNWVDYAFSEFEKSGYSVTSAYTAVKNPAKTKFVYRDRLWAGADMLATGVASFGHLGGIHYQNLPHIEQYQEALEEDLSAVSRALMTTEDERFLRELILQWKIGQVNLNYFREKFGQEIETRFEGVLTNLEKRQFLERGEDELRLTRQGLLQVDTLLHDFFQEKHQGGKYA